MKKVFLLICLLGSMFLATTNAVAIDVDIKVTDSATVSATTATASATTAKSDYFLPYPGILADNPLYPLKMLRDKIMSFFIPSDKKIDFYLLMADKRLAGGCVLISFGKWEKGLSVVSKAQNYFDRAIDQTKNMDNELKIKNTQKLLSASQTHLQYLQDALAKTPQEGKLSVEALIKRTQDQYATIAKMLNFAP